MIMLDVKEIPVAHAAPANPMSKTVKNTYVRTTLTAAAIPVDFIGKTESPTFLMKNSKTKLVRINPKNIKITEKYSRVNS